MTTAPLPIVSPRETTERNVRFDKRKGKGLKRSHIHR